MSASIAAFDKDGDRTEFGLYKRALVHQLGIADSVDKAVQSDASCIFVHVLDEDWEKICEGLSEGRVALRFSTAGFRPKSPEGKHGGCFRCLKPTKNDGKLTHQEFEALIRLFADADSVGSLRWGIIPPSVRGLISFEFPHRVRALHILLQGCLAEWASDRFNPHAVEASKLLGSIEVPHYPGFRINRAQMFCSVLSGRNCNLEQLTSADKSSIEHQTMNSITIELGMKVGDTDESITIVRKLVETVLRSDGEDAVSWGVIQPVFLALEQALGNRNHTKP